MKLVGPDGRKLADDRRVGDRGRAPHVARPAPTRAASGPGRRRSSALASASISTRTSRICSARSRGGRSPGCTWWSTARTARRRSSRRARCSRRARSVDVMNARARRAQHQRRVRLDVSGAVAGAVRAAGADLGLALDGDADRVLAVDENGELVDGDQIMVMTALDWHERGMLRNDAIVVTVMSNLGLRRALDRRRGRDRRDAGRRPQRHGRDGRARPRDRRRAVGPHRVRRSRDHRRRRAHRADRRRSRRAPGRDAVGAGRGHDPPAPGAGERAPGPGGRPRRRSRPCRQWCARSRPSSATGAG